MLTPVGQSRHRTSGGKAANRSFHARVVVLTSLPSQTYVCSISRYASGVVPVSLRKSLVKWL